MPSDAWSTVITTVLARVRDPDGAVHTLPLCQDLLTRLEQLYNNHLRLVVSDFTLPTRPGLQLYSLAQATGGEADPQGMQVLEVRHNNRHLERMTFSQLKALDPRWPRAIGPRLDGFIQLGYTMLLLWPSLMYADTVSVTATKLTTLAASTLNIPSQATPKLAQLLELLLLLRQRDMLSFNVLMQQLDPQKGQANAPTQAS